MNRTYLLVVGALAAVGLLIVAAIASTRVGVSTPTPSGNGQTACTMEAKLCPDGSYVGRTGPACAFAACPVVVTPTSTLPTAGWKTATDATQTYSFSYPPTLGTNYVSLVDWPPVLKTEKATTFRCAEAGSETASAGKTERTTINGREYCVTRESEGAAGSVYRQYAFVFANENDVLTLTFTLRYVQCGNYDEPNASNCTAEQSSLDVDKLVDQMTQTIHRVSLLQ